MRNIVIVLRAGKRNETVDECVLHVTSGQCCLVGVESWYEGPSSPGGTAKIREAGHLVDSSQSSHAEKWIDAVTGVAESLRTKQFTSQ